MKKTALTLIGIMAFGLATYAQLEKVALISVWGDKNLSDDPMETKMYEKLLNDPSYNLTTQIKQFDELIQNDIIPMFSFPFMPKTEVVGNPRYEELRPLGFEERKKPAVFYTEPAEGYIPIASFGKAVFQDDEAIKKSFEVFEGVDGVMVVYINFNLIDESGVGPYAKKVVQGNVNIKIFNKEGERIFKLKESAKSDKGVSSVGGIVTEPKKIMPLIQQSTDNLIADIKKKMPKKIAKMEDKMAKDATKGK